MMHRYMAAPANIVPIDQCLRVEPAWPVRKITRADIYARRALMAQNRKLRFAYILLMREAMKAGL